MCHRMRLHYLQTLKDILSDVPHNETASSINLERHCSDGRGSCRVEPRERTDREY